MEKLIVIAVIVIASLVHSWIQRKQEEAAEKESAPPPDRNRRRTPRTGSDPTTPPPSRDGTDWETELRRLLGGEVAPPAPPPVPAPPPLPTPTQPARVKITGKSAPAAPPSVLARSAIPVPDDERETQVGMPVQLQKALSAHDRAQSLGNVSQRMRDTLIRVSEHEGGTGGAKTAKVARIARTARKAKMSVELGTILPLERSAGVRHLLRDRASQRAAILASVILGPPRAIERRQEY